MAIQTLTLDPNAQSIEDQRIMVINETGSGLDEGDLVYVSGWDETTGRWNVSLSQAAAIGGALAQYVLRNAIANGANGLAYKSHRLENQNTSGALEGDPVYLSRTVAGGYTLTPPAFARQVVGRVAVVNVTTGVVELFVQADTDSGFIRTDPGSGQFPIAAVQRTSTGFVEVDYDDVAAT